MIGRFCFHCGGDANALDHAMSCDGRQGAVEARYPEGAGWKEPTTSREAAAMVDASALRVAVRLCLAQRGAMTADECARALGASVLAIRPRFSELRTMAVIADTGVRHHNASGKRAIVWALTDAER